MATEFTIKILGDSKGFDKAVKASISQATKQAKGLQGAFNKFGGFSKNFFFMSNAIKSIIGPLKGFTQASDVQEKALAQLTSTLESTQHAAGLTKEELVGFASELQSATTFGDEAIINMQAVLLTFTNVQGKVFKDANKIILDMSAALGTNLKDASIQVGKALNDPIKGVSALSRVGVSFTQQQKDLIKTLTDTGDAAGAQAIILAELNKEFGGTAEALAQTNSGQLQQFNNLWGDTKEVLGDLVKDVLVPMVATGKDVLIWVNTLNPDIVKLTGVITALGIAIGTAFTLGLGPVGLAIAGIIAVVAALAIAWQQNFFGIRETLEKAAVWIRTFGQIAGIVFTTLADKVKKTFGFLADTISGVFSWINDNVIQPFVERIQKVFAFIGKIIGKTWDFVKDKADESAKLALASFSDGQDGILSKIQEVLEASNAQQDEITAKYQDEADKKVEIETNTQDKIRAQMEATRQKQEEDRIAAAEKRTEDAEAKLEKMREQEEAELELKSEFQLEGLIANEFFGLQITANETKTAQGRLAIWNKTTKLFKGDMKSFIKNFAKQKAVEGAVHLLTEKTKTTATAAGTTARTSMTVSGFTAEGVALIGSTVKWLGNMTAKLFAWLASLGPFGLLAGTGVVLGAIAAVKGIIKAISFAHGGEVNQPTLAVVGDAGPEIIAPRKDFFKVLKSAPELRSGAETPAALTKEDLTEAFIDSLKGANFKVAFDADAEEFSLFIEKGNILRAQEEF